ncbi:hypothetical protein [Burkholderia sp. MSMB1552]|uniref:hypothetical protein n=1 Tax=Burkholderia sp. MSMB1552 TaxID=1636424 RepID=UPI0012E33126|nr:hypothetical protein [Burkholderia sp. MSMB1552]
MRRIHAVNARLRFMFAGSRPRAARPKTVGDRCGPGVDRYQSESETCAAFRRLNAARDSLQKDDAPSAARDIGPAISFQADDIAPSAFNGTAHAMTMPIGHERLSTHPREPHARRHGMQRTGNEHTASRIRSRGRRRA